MGGSIRVIGIGNRYRRDDGFGELVADRLRALLPDSIEVLALSGEGVELMEAFEGADKVTIVDAARGGGDAGTYIRLDAAEQTIPSDFFHYSTHAFSVAEAIELSRVLGSLPTSVILHAVVGADFSAGEGLTPIVARQINVVCQAVVAEHT
ncbi:MAG: hydrogenase maturation protease [Rhodothermales bacterium]